MRWDPKYLEELGSIDASLEPLLESLVRRSHFLVIITSDHGGHGREHGTDHREDARIPFVPYSDMMNTAPYQDIPYSVTDLKPLLDAISAP